MRFEMTITREELLRLLPGAVGGAFVEVDSAFLHQEPGRSWRIDLEPLPPLALGAIRMERLAVDLTFQGYTEVDQEAFLERFRNHTRRGGG